MVTDYEGPPCPYEPEKREGVLVMTAWRVDYGTGYVLVVGEKVKSGRWPGFIYLHPSSPGCKEMPGPTMLGTMFSSVPPSHLLLPSRRWRQTQELPHSERQLAQSRNGNRKRAGRLSATGRKHSFSYARPLACCGFRGVTTLPVQNCSSLRHGTTGGRGAGGVD